MDTLRKSYPQILDIFLETALSEADGDELVALELLRTQISDEGRSCWCNAKYKIL
jgi:hypothetical protein